MLAEIKILKSTARGNLCWNIINCEALKHQPLERLSPSAVDVATHSKHIFFSHTSSVLESRERFLSADSNDRSRCDGTMAEIGYRRLMILRIN